MKEQREKKEKNKAEEDRREWKIVTQSEKEWSDCEAGNGAPHWGPGHLLQKTC